MGGSLWLKNGRIIVQDGQATACDDCPCDPPSDSDSSGSSSSESDSSSTCCYDCFTVCDLNISRDIWVSVGGVMGQLPTVEGGGNPFEAAGSITIPGCGIVDVIVTIDDDCNVTIDVDGVSSGPLTPDVETGATTYQTDPFNVDVTITHPQCGDLQVTITNGGTEDGCIPICCDPPSSSSDSSSSGSSSSGSSGSSDSDSGSDSGSSGSSGTGSGCVCCAQELNDNFELTVTLNTSGGCGLSGDFVLSRTEYDGCNEFEYTLPAQPWTCGFDLGNATISLFCRGGSVWVSITDEFDGTYVEGEVTVNSCDPFDGDFSLDDWKCCTSITGSVTE